MNSTIGNQDNVRLPRQAFPIGDYALISDCHCAALVSRRGSLDWCCMPRFDCVPCFGRLLDWEHAGYCSIAPAPGGFDCTRRYLEDTSVVPTAVRTGRSGPADGGLTCVSAQEAMVFSTA